MKEDEAITSVSQLGAGVIAFKKTTLKGASR
jgi:hypothetical protein